ncbi:MAG: hypothetical protein WD034_01510 [Parvibaculum sp.]|uniref:hypothetical protein n=1 Tax=Parvibaculum sp. TaxID=2024848 RepID=UPI0034A09FC2
MSQIWDGNDLTGFRSSAKSAASRTDETEPPRVSDFLIVGVGLAVSASISTLGLWKLVELVIV